MCLEFTPLQLSCKIKFFRVNTHCCIYFFYIFNKLTTIYRLNFLTLNPSKMHTTNYFNAFISIAEDCLATAGEMPPQKANAKTVANIQFDMLKDKPYEYTSDDVIFGTYAQKNDISTSEIEKEKEAFFSKGQPCFRSSPLTKRYGWGVHSNGDGKIAIYPAGSDEYEKLSTDKNLNQVKAMRSKKA